MLFILSALYLLATTFAASAIVIENYQDSGNYYYGVDLKNIANSCGNSVDSVSIRVGNKWITNNQQYGNSYRWDYGHVGSIKFSDMLPISIRIATKQRTITKWGIVKNINGGSTFNTNELMCDGSPTAKPTPKPVAQPTKPTAPSSGSSTCINKGSIEWTSKNNQLYLNGKRFNMKALSWFGFETGNYNLHGLDKHNMDWYFNWMRNNGFNAMRLPFSVDFMKGGVGNRNLYKAAVQKAGEYGIFVMLDMHSNTAGAWRDGLYTINKQDAINTWVTVTNLLKNEYNVFMVDVFNEPHDVLNDQWGEWIQFCEDVAAAVWARGVDWLIAVEGTNYDCSVISCAWGENLEGPRNKGIVFDLKKTKFVWSPHVYGQDVTGNSQYSNAAWEAHFGYLTKKNYGGTRAAITIGEFGTTYKGNMQNWLKSLITYLISIDQRGHFYWSLNPNSGDTGGLLKSDWTTPETAKLTQLARLQPTPSKVTLSGSKICVSNLGNPSSLAFTEEEADESGLNSAEIAAIIIVSLLVIGCCIIGGIYYKKRKSKQGQASFEETQVETPRETPEAPETPTTGNINDDGEAEIEIEMNATETRD